jgi:hypothetical protein
MARENLEQMSFHAKLNKEKKEDPDSEAEREKGEGVDLSESEFSRNKRNPPNDNRTEGRPRQGFFAPDGCPLFSIDPE